MARITVEDCLKNVDNRFELIHLAAKRVRQLRKGAEPLVICKNKDIVVSLREVASGRVYKGEAQETESLIEAGDVSMPEVPPEHTEEGTSVQEQGDQEAPPEEK